MKKTSQEGLEVHHSARGAVIVWHRSGTDMFCHVEGGLKNTNQKNENILNKKIS